MVAHEANSKNIRNLPFCYSVEKAQWTKMKLLVKEEGMKRNGEETKDVDCGQRGRHTSMYEKRPRHHEQQAISAGLS